MWASVWNYDPETGEIGDSIGKVTDHDMIVNRLRDILDTHIVIGDVEDGREYYRTKGGTELRVKNVKDGANGMTVEGSYQVNEGQPIPVSFIYDQTKGGNGKTYILENQPILGTRMTVRDVLASREEFSKFLELMDISGIFEEIHQPGNFACGGTNVSIFNTYHYTIYVPTNESIDQLQAEGKLPVVDWDEDADENVSDEELKARKKAIEKIAEFVKYHIQDNALYIGANPESGDYETGQLNAKTERFYRLKATLTDNALTIQDEVDKANNTTHHVITTNPELYNLQAREYIYNDKDAASAKMLETSSSAVIHLIDRPLLLE